MNRLSAACLLLVGAVAVTVAAPLESTNQTIVNETPDCNEEGKDVYDQRQNGTENYRIHVNGVVVLVAPAEAVLQAAQLGMGEADVGVASRPKPRPPTPAAAESQSEGAAPGVVLIHPKDPQEKNNMKLFNFLHMLRSIRHETEEPVDHSKN